MNPPHRAGMVILGEAVADNQRMQNTLSRYIVVLIAFPPDMAPTLLVPADAARPSPGMHPRRGE
jgi:hypothetical protein